MRGSIRLGKPLGIDVFAHWSLWGLLLVIGVVSFAASRDLSALTVALVSVVVLFGW